MKIGETAMSCFGCLREATGPKEDSGQLGTARRDHLPITESYVDFERLSEIRKS
jgi:hypothetical protein